MSIKIGKKVGKIRRETTDLDWDDFKTFLEEKGYADSTICKDIVLAKRVVRNGLTDDKLYVPHSGVTCIVRHNVRRGIKKIYEYKQRKECKCR